MKSHLRKRNPPAANERQTVHNRILRSLPGKALDFLWSRLEFVRLPARTILNESARAIEFGYFMESGMAQVMSVLANGKSVAVGLTGVEGFVGGPLVVGLRSPTRAITQMDSAGHRISAGDLETAVLKCSELERLLLRYSHELTIQSTQIAACNQFHSLGERMARLLLMTRDRLGDTFSITQQSISDLLGARRASVNVAVKIIQDARAISCGRGRLTIENLAVLKSASCECYQTINELARIAG